MILIFSLPKGIGVTLFSLYILFCKIGIVKTVKILLFAREPTVKGLPRVEDGKDSPHILVDLLQIDEKLLVV